MNNTNYEIIEKRFIKDLNSEGLILHHKKTGAVVTLLLNDDENKVFYIGFKTPPKDSTGVAHILEHSVLCGSSKYPVKDPFIELAKGSLNTFLNAMTYPDKTVYPVASCNDADFKNLVDVYLDAVFYPNIYKEEKIFKQEGWHYEIDETLSNLSVNGVVYNEMKGVYSSPDDVVETYVMQSLYPDTTYGLESGGDPEVIPTLTYEDFLAFHGKYYHPSNSFIYLYGNMDAEEYLDYLDKEYLSKFDKEEVLSDVKLQQAFDEKKCLEMEYAVLEDAEDEGTYLTYNISLGTSLDKNLYIALDVLDYVLISAPGAMIKQALLDEGIGDDVYSSVEGGIYQPFFSIIAKGATYEDYDKFVAIIERKLKEAFEGLPKKSLKAAINTFEFKYREADFGSYPKGLMLGLNALDSWLYDKSKPFLHIEANDTYAYLKSVVDEGYFEKLIEKYFIENNHKTIIRFSPKKGLTKIKDDALKERLETIRKSMSGDELKKVYSDMEELKAYQSEPSKKEDLEKIPLLKHEDLKKEAVKPVNEIIDVNGTTCLYHDIFTNGISYLRLLFNINDVPADLLGYVGLLKGVLTVVDTENYSYVDLFDEINTSTGGIAVSSNCFVDYSSKEDTLNNFFEVKCKYLYANAADAMKLIREIIVHTKYTDTKRLKEIINELKMRMQSSMVSSGHVVAACRGLSYSVKSAFLNEQINGVDFYKFIVNLSDNFEAQKAEIVEKLTLLSHIIFRKENLIVDLTSEKVALDDVMSFTKDIKDDLFEDGYEKKPVSYNFEKKNEGFITAGAVQYVARCGNFVTKGLPYTGALRVLKVMMGYDYLWNNIRVLGGAYGCMSSFNRHGDAYFVSYRDPNLKNTVEVYERAAEYIKNVPLDDRNVLQFIIGALSELDVPMTPQTKGGYSLTTFLTGITFDDIQRDRDELLNVDADILHGLSRYIEAFMSDDIICVVGSQDAVNDNKEMFKTTEKII